MSIVANLVEQTTTSTGTGNLTLAAVDARQTCASAIGTGSSNTFAYFIMHESADEWERGTGYMSDSTTLVRSTVHESSNSDLAVDFSAGTKRVTNAMPADELISKVRPVADRTALAALNTSVYTTAFLKESGRAGLFQWDAADLSTYVGYDAQQGIYVPPSSDPTGASGAWVRVYDNAVRVKWFGAAEDGTTDDATALQAAYDFVNSLGGGTVIHDGLCATNSALTFGPGTALVAASAGAGLKVGSGLSLSATVLTNKTIPSGINNRSDSNLKLVGMTLDGASVANRTGTFVQFTKCIDVIVEGCTIKDHTYISLADAGTLRGIYRNNTFESLGRSDLATPAIWSQSYTADQTDSINTQIVGNTFVGVQRSGIHAHMRGGIVASNKFDACTESCIFMSGQGNGTDLCRDIIIEGNSFSLNTIANVVAAGVEINNGRNITIDGNIFDSTGTQGIGAQNADGLVVSNNIFKNTGQGTNGAAITLTTNARIDGACKDIVISSNVFIENGTGTQEYIVEITQAGSGPATITGFKFVDNVIENGYATAPFTYSSNKLGTDAVIQDFGNGAVNLLNNGLFDTWQRGTSFTSATTPANNDDAYLADQWVLLSDGNNIVSVAREATTVPSGSRYAMTATIVTANKKFGFAQFLPNIATRKLRSRKASFSVQMRGSGSSATTNVKIAVLEWTGTADTITSDVVSAWNADDTLPTLATSWAFIGTSDAFEVDGKYRTFRLDGVGVGASANNLAVLIWSDDLTTTVGNVLYCGDARLSDSQLCVNPINIVSERESLERCLHFFERIAADNANDALCNASAQTIGIADGLFTHAPKRSAPSYSASSGIDVQVGGAAVTGGTVSFFRGVGGRYDRSLIRIAKASSFTVGQSGYISFNSSTDYIDISAEL